MFLALAHAIPGAAAGAEHALLSFHSLAALVTLSVLEIVLGIDNVVFLAILTGKLEPARQKVARRVGLGLAMVARILLLLGIGWVMGLTAPWFTVAGHELSGKDLILLGGGAFLLTKAVIEIYHSVEGGHAEKVEARAFAAFGAVIAQVVVMDLIFSLDSVITAVGMSRQIPIMIAAIVVAIVIMMIFAEPVSKFIEAHPSVKILALAFLVLIGVLLIAEGLGEHINKGYVYTALAFSVLVEALQIRASKKHGRA